jgi:OmpA-OmpF porin, OOP family
VHLRIFEHPNKTKSFKMKLTHTAICFGLVLAMNGQTAGTGTTTATSTHENLGPNINSTAGELCATISASGKTMYYIRSEHPDNYARQDVWVSYLGTDGKWSMSTHPGKPINTGRNSSIFAVSADENKILVRGTWEEGEYAGAGISYLAKNKKGEWGTPVKLEIANFKLYSDLGGYNGAFLCNDGKTLLMYFSEKNNDERSDIYVSHLILKEKWKKPKGLKDVGRFFNKLLKNDMWTEPEKIKAISPKEYDDFGAVMASDGVTMYYSSDRKGGQGKNDIWMTRRLDSTWQKWSEPVNLGPKINTENWDAYYSIDARGEYAYMSSSANSIGNEDIVRIKLAEDVRPNPVILISGKVFNAKTKEPLGANIEYENLGDGKNAGVAISNPQTGEYKIVLPYGTNYGFLAYADKFLSVSENLDLSTTAEYKEITRDLYLVPFEIGETIRLNNIFFDTGKDSLRVESYPELDRLAGIMGDNNKMQIELSGHTDNVGNADANLKLSDNRAKAVTRYLVSKGIAAERINAKGYGETKPVGSNDNEEGKQLNRRVEFTILKN